MFHGMDRERFSLVLDTTWSWSPHLSELMCGMHWLCPTASWHHCFGGVGLWYVAVCLISPQREQMDSYGA